MKTFKFTEEQITQLISDSIDMFIQYRDGHGHDEDKSQTFAILEMREGLKADQELIDNGHDKGPSKIQVYP